MASVNANGTALWGGVTSTAGLVIEAGAGDRPTTPKNLVATRAVQVKGGWIGQIIMRGDVVFETDAAADYETALEEVNVRIHERLRRLFVDDIPAYEGE